MKKARVEQPGQRQIEGLPMACDTPCCSEVSLASVAAAGACCAPSHVGGGDERAAASRDVQPDASALTQPAPESESVPSRRTIEDRFARLAERTSSLAGNFWAFALALCTVLGWAVLGPVFDFSETWQLVINTGTTIITFLMVFVIQHAQNKEMRAVQLKLNEIIAAVEGASNRLIDIEDLSERELTRLYVRYQHMAVHAKKLAIGAATSVENED